MSGFNLDDYVTVAERVEQFYAKFPEGSLQAEVVEMSERLVVVRAYAYRQPDDPRPGIAHSSLIIPGSTPYTKGSELENAETSAVGRAIALLGFEVKKSIASRNELEAKGAGGRDDGTNGGLIGTAVKQRARTTDFSLRETADGGAHIGFRLASGAGAGVICEARDDLARTLPALEADIIGQRLQVWGAFVTYGPEQGVQHPYKAFRVTRIQTPSGLIPASEGAPGAVPEAQAAPVPPMGEGADAQPDEPQSPTAAPVADSSDAALGSSQPDRTNPPADECGADSPYGDGEHCELLTGHKGHHKVLSTAFPETWAAA